MPDLSKLAEQELPVDSLRAATPHFRRPFTRETVKWKVQTTWEGDRAGALIVAHLDARLVVERLNAIVPDMWEEDFKSFGSLLMCELTVAERTHRDVGEGQGKALVSDALKRAAVKFGIGVSVYALPRVELYVGSEANQLRTQRKKKKKGNEWVWADVPFIDTRTLGKLRDGYDKWLTEKGTPMFGPVLDHGWSAEAQGDEGEPEEPSAEAPAEPAADVQPPLETPEAKELVTEIERVYALVRARNARRLPPGEKRRMVEGAQHSIEELRAVLLKVEALRDELQEASA